MRLGGDAYRLLYRHMRLKHPNGLMGGQEEDDPILVVNQTKLNFVLEMKDN